MRYLIHTLGCKANWYDSQKLEADLLARGLRPFDASASPDEVQVCVVNSCTVTDQADRDSKKAASRLARKFPRAQVVLTGCGAEVDPQAYREVPGVGWVVGNREKARLAELVLAPEASYEEILSQNPMDREWPTSEKLFVPPVALSQESRAATTRTRVFLKIQEGCDQYCTYCIIPFGRGPARSLPPEQVVESVSQAVEKGAREVILTGTNLGDYGRDRDASLEKGRGFARLVREILEKTRLERLRLSSLDPVEITSELRDLMRNNTRLCPHFHVSLQSPHSRILKRMKRGYSTEDVETCLHEIQRIPAPPGGVFVGMDVITGFPGESSEDFDWTYRQLENLPWTRLHVFPYSERAGTPATRLPESVPWEERVERSRALQKLSLARVSQRAAESLRAYRSRNQKISDVLLEKRVKGPDGQADWSAGYSPHYLRVLVKDWDKAPNALVSVEGREVWVDRALGEASVVAIPAI